MPGAYRSTMDGERADRFPPRYTPGMASAPDWASPVTAVPAGESNHPTTAILVDDEPWAGPEHWRGWEGGRVPYPKPPEWNGPPAPPRRGWHVLRWVVGVITLVGLALVVGGAGLVAILEARTESPTSRPTTGTQPNANAPKAPSGTPDELTTEASAAPSGPVDTATVVATVNKSVINITSTLGLRNSRSAGTGIVLTSTGLVLTNNHVIAGATSISAVAVANGRTFQASVVGYDRSRDIAVLQLANASNLPRIAMVNSSTVEVGDPIIAVGNAGGVGGTPTAVSGSVTALNQTINAQEPDGGGSQRLNGLIEVAADIRPGDSGGPLVDAAGRLIGVNTAASADPKDQAAGGRGFAIPSNAAITIAQQIQQGKESATVHIGPTALLGVSAADANGQGAAVTGVVDGSPAERGGLANGDVIRSIDGRDIGSARDLTAFIDTKHPGDQITISYTDRNGRSRQASVRLATGPAG
jgi:S1-C subfamily serine protease